jgi:hypothetical protein
MIQVQARISYQDIERGERYVATAIRHLFAHDSHQVMLQIRGRWLDACAFVEVEPRPDVLEGAPCDFRHLLGNRE